MQRQFWINCALLLYIVPTYALYIFQFYIIYLSTARKKFGSSFYFIYGATAINDILAHLTYNINFRYLYTMDGVDALASRLGHHWVCTALFAFAFHVFYNHSLFVIALSANRYTILTMKEKHASFWDRHRTHIILIIVSLPFVLTAPIIFDGNGGMLIERFVENNITPGYVVVEDAEQNIFHNHGLHAAAVEFVCIVTCMFLNFTVSYQLWNQTQHNIRQGVARFGSRTHRADIMLFFYSVICMLLEIFVFITQTAFAVASSRNYNEATIMLLNIQQYVLDAQFLFPAWFMVIASSQMKKEIVERLSCGNRLNAIFNSSISMPVKFLNGRNTSLSIPPVQ